MLAMTGKQLALEAFGISDALRACAQEALEDTWFSVPVRGSGSSDTQVWSRQGTRPGDPCADVNFAAIISRAIAEIHSDIEPMMPRIQYDAAESEALPPTLWADDVALCLQADTSEVLVEAVRACVSATQRMCRKHGLLLNFSKGKSEVLLKLHGPQSAAIGRRLHFDEAGQLAFASHKCGRAETAYINITPAYKHLGGFACAAGHFRAEVRHRIGRASQALKDVRKVLVNRHISLQGRLNILKSCVFSVLFFGSETWLGVTAKQLRSPQAVCMRGYRTIAAAWNNSNEGRHVTDAEVLRTLEQPSAEIIIRVNRLRYWRRFLQHAPNQLQQLVIDEDKHLKQSWLELVKHDLAWLKACLPDSFQGYPSPWIDMQKWAAIAGWGDSKWKGILSRAVSVDILRNAIQNSYEEWRKRFETSLFEAGGVLSPDSAVRTPEILRLHTCEFCNQSFNTAAALSVHAYKKHNAFSICRRYAGNGTVCHACIARLRQHLQYAPNTCLQRLQYWEEPLDNSQVTRVSVEPHLQGHHRVPCQRLPGPALPPVTCEDRHDWESPVEAAIECDEGARCQMRI